MVNVARLIGPSLAGMVIAVSSEGWCFLIDGISYMAVIASLLMMRVPAPAVKRARHLDVHRAEGGMDVRFAAFVPIRTILLLFAVISLMGMPFVVLMPIFAARVLHGGPHTLGFLMGAMGVGALVSALSLAARRSSVRGLIRMIPSPRLSLALGLIGFGLSHTFWLSMVMMLVAGIGMMQGMASSNTIIQTLVSEDKRGRVMSYYTMAFMGMAPFGSLLAGTMAHADRRANHGDCERSRGCAAGRGVVHHTATSAEASLLEARASGLARLGRRLLYLCGHRRLCLDRRSFDGAAGLSGWFEARATNCALPAAR
jgi:MFS family permease